MSLVADAELVERSRKRDTGAFGELVERHQRLVFGVALARCKDPMLAEDLAQEAFVTAWRDLDRLRDGERIGSWVAGIARNLAASAARDRVRHEQAEPPPAAVAVQTPEDAALEREDRELLARALAEVPDAHREALVLYYLEGESIARIAGGLGITEDLVKQRLSRGRRALREGVAKRVETALVRTRERPGLRAGVIAALAVIPMKKAAAATTAGKAIALMSIKKVTVAAVVLALAGGAIWFATRSPDDHRDAAASTVGGSASPARSPDSTKVGVRKIDAKTRATLLDAIRTTAQRRDVRTASTPSSPSTSSSSSSSGPRPELPGGEIDKSYIRSAVRELVPLLQDCYEKGMAADPKLRGTVMVSFTIEAEPGVGGVVGESAIVPEKTTLPDPAVQECIQETMYGLEIDPPANGGVVRVNYPFTFRPVDAPATE